MPAYSAPGVSATSRRRMSESHNHASTQPWLGAKSRGRLEAHRPTTPESQSQASLELELTQPSEVLTPTSSCSRRENAAQKMAWHTMTRECEPSNAHPTIARRDHNVRVSFRTGVTFTVGHGRVHVAVALLIHFCSLPLMPPPGPPQVFLRPHPTPLGTVPNTPSLSTLPSSRSVPRPPQ